MKRRDFLKLSGATCLALASMELDNYFFRPLKASEVSELPGSLGAKEIPSVCDMCFWRCPIVVKVKNGKVIKIEGNPKSPTNGARICARGNAGIQALYDKDRLKYPLKRTGARGEGKWVRISWDEALDEIAENIKKVKDKYGVHSLALFDHGSSSAFFRSIFEAMGTENFSNEPAFFHCVGPVMLAYLFTVGYQVTTPAKVDYENAKAILLVGSHLGENVQVSQIRAWLRGLSKGAKLVVVDPRFSTAAAKADIWLPIRPGTDMALLLAWINYVIKKGLYDHEFVKKHCKGFEEVKEAVSEYSLSWAAKICDLPEKDIKKAIEILAEARPNVAIHPGRHSVWYGDQDVQRHRALAILTGLFGAIGVPGGLIFPTKVPLAKAEFLDLEEEPEIEAPETSLKEDFPFAEIFHGSPTARIIEATLTGKPYPVKLWGVCGVNLLQTIPNPYQTIEAIKKLDFIFTVDVMPTESSIWSDIVLPDATYLERYDHIYVGKETKSYVTVRQPVIKPMFESRSAFWIGKELARRLGFKPKFEREEDYLNYQLKPLKLSIDKLNAQGGLVVYKAKPYRKREELELNTDSGKFELAVEAFSDEDFDEVPKFMVAPAPPKGYVRLVYGRVPLHTFSKTMNNLWLNHEMPENKLWVNDEIAKRLGLKDGEEIILENQDGYRSLPVKIFVTPGIRPDVVFLPHGYGSRSPMMTRAYKKGASDTFLMTHVDIEPMMGASSRRNNFVRFIKGGKVLNIPELRPIPPEIPRFEVKKSA